VPRWRAGGKPACRPSVVEFGTRGRKVRSSSRQPAPSGRIGRLTSTGQVAAALNRDFPLAKAARMRHNQNG
jgi:hypothetical protein